MGAVPQRPTPRKNALALALLCLAFILGALAWRADAPEHYAASGRVLAPEGASQAELAAEAVAAGVTLHAKRGSRVLIVQKIAADPSAAAQAVNAFLRTRVRAPIVVVDEASTPREALVPVLPRALAGAALIAALCAVVAWWRRPEPRTRGTILVDMEADGGAGLRIEPFAGRRDVFVLRAPEDRVGAFAAQAARRYRVVILGRKAAGAA